jgi:hypothetical protein
VSAVLERRSEPAPSQPEPRTDGDRRWRFALAGAMLLAAVVVLYAGRGTGFWFDEWNWVFDRRGWTLDALLEPHNEHLSLVPVLIYKLGFVTVGLESYLPYRLVLLALHLVCAGLLFAYARPRVGPAFAFAAAAVLLFLGPAWQDILWGFQIGYLASLACGLGALLALDRRTRGADAAAALLLTLALASSSLGIPLLAAAAFEVASRPGRARRWPVIAAPMALYGLWYAVYGVSQGITTEDIIATPEYMAEMAAAAVGAVFGLGAEWGRPLALALAALVAWRALTLVHRPWRLAVLVALPLVFWALTGLARATFGEPAAPRYIYPGALFVLLVLVETGAGLRPSRRALALVLALLAGITAANAGRLLEGGGWLRDRQASIQGALAATDLAGPAVPAGFQPALQDSPQITAGAYRAVRSRLSPPPADLTRAPRHARTGADAALLRLGAVALRPGGGASGAPAVAAAAGVTTAPAGGCLRATGDGELTVPVPAGGLAIAASGGDVAVAVRRYGDGPVDLATVRQGATQTVTARADRSPAPWLAKLKITGEARVCGA